MLGKIRFKNRLLEVGIIVLSFLFIGLSGTSQVFAKPDHTASTVDPIESEWERLDPEKQSDDSYEVTLEDFKKLYPNDEWKNRYVKVDSWDTVGDKVGFYDAMMNYKYEYIEVEKDIDDPKGYTTGTTGATNTGIVRLSLDQKRYKIIDGKRPDGSHAKVNFRGTNFVLRMYYSPYRIVVQNLDQYSVNYYGPISHRNSDYSNISYSYHNINHTGDQMVHSLLLNAYISGEMNVQGLAQFQFDGEEFKTNNTDENMLVSNMTIAPKSKVTLYSESDGNIAVGDGDLKIGENAVLNLSTRNGQAWTKNYSGGASQPNNIIIKDGNKGGAVLLDKKATINILAGTDADFPIQNQSGRNKWRSYAAIYFEGKNSKFTLSEGAKVNIDVLNSTMDRNNSQPADTSPIILAGAGSVFRVGKNAELNLNVRQDRTTYLDGKNEKEFITGDSPIIKTAADTEFIVEPKGNFIVNVDIPGRRNMLQMAKGALFRFNDANRVDLRFTKDNVNQSSNLISMAEGHFDVDVQEIKLWEHGNISEDNPTFRWAPMFGLNVPYKNEKITPTKTNPFIVASVNDETVQHFKTNFKTDGGMQRLLYEHIPDTHAALEDKNGKIVGLDENSNSPTQLSIITNKTPTGDTLIKGLTVPGSYVRLTAKHPAENLVPKYPNELASVENTVKSPVTSEGETDILTEMKGNYTFSPSQTEESSGRFEVVIPKEVTFSPATILHAYAFKAGKTASDEKQIRDLIPPEAEKNPVYMVKRSSAAIKAQDFVKDVTDTNPINLGFDYNFVNESQLKKDELGTHSVDISVKDQPKNLFAADEHDFYAEQNEKVIKSELRVYDTPDVIEAQDVEWKVNDILSLSATERKNKLKEDSKLKGITINTSTNAITDKTGNVTYTIPDIPNNGGTYEIEFKLNNTKKKITLKVIPSDVTMTRKYVYKNQPELSIYTDLTDKESNSVEKTVKIEKVRIGSDLTITEPLYDGYTLVETAVVVGNETSSTLPEQVPDKDFTITYLFDGKIGISEPADISFNKIAVNKSGVTEHQPKDSLSVKVENTLRPEDPTKNYYLTVKLTDKIKNKKNNKAYLGNLVYRPSLVTKVKNISETEALPIMGVDNLIQEVPLKSNKPNEGLFLQQFSGNLAGEYFGTLEWNFSDAL